MKKVFRVKNWKIDRFSFFLKKGFSSPSRCATIFCVMFLCMSESQCVPFDATKCHSSALCNHFPGEIRLGLRDEKKSWKLLLRKILQTLNYIFGLFMKLSPFWMGGASYFLLCLPSRSPLLVCSESERCEGGKINEKKMFFVRWLRYIRRNSLPKERQVPPRKKLVISTIAPPLSFFFGSHTPFYCLLVSSFLVTRNWIERKTSWKENKRKKMLLFGVQWGGSLDCRGYFRWKKDMSGMEFWARRGERWKWMRKLRNSGKWGKFRQSPKSLPNNLHFCPILYLFQLFW